RGDDDLLLAPGDAQEAVVVERAEVARAEPAVDERLRRGLLVVVVPAEHVVALEQDLAVLGDADRAAGQLRADGPDLGGRGPVDAGRRRGLGEAVALEDADADAAVEVPEALAERGAAGHGELGAA